MRSSYYLPLAAIAVLGLTGLAATTELFPILKSTVKIGRQSAGFFVLPTNQLLQPWGEQATLKGRPVDAALDSEKRFLAVLNSRGIDIFDAKTPRPLAPARNKSSSYTGIAFRPEHDVEFWSSETARSGGDAILITPVSPLGVPGAGQRDRAAAATPFPAASPSRRMARRLMSR